MTDITIPPEALEAAKEAITPLRHNQFVTTGQLARAACLAMLNAWPGMHAGPAPADARRQSIILPLTEDPQ